MMWEESQVKSEQVTFFSPSRRLLEIFLVNGGPFCRRLLFVPCCLGPKLGLDIQLVTEKAAATTTQVTLSPKAEPQVESEHVPLCSVMHSPNQCSKCGTRDPLSLCPSKWEVTGEVKLEQTGAVMYIQTSSLRRTVLRQCFQQT